MVWMCVCENILFMRSSGCIARDVGGLAFCFFEIAKFLA
jgi:hypothetical protein